MRLIHVNTCKYLFYKSFTVFFLQVVECQYLECLKILLDHGAQANVVDVNNSTSLHLAAANGDTDAAVLLLEREAKVDAKDKVF